MSNRLDLALLEIVEALPSSRFYPVGGEDELQRLSGATILRIGSFAENADLEGGGLAMDYRNGGGETRRIVFAFNENGMWIACDGQLADRNR
jgi:hypothetical protein